MTTTIEETTRRTGELTTSPPLSAQEAVIASGSKMLRPGVIDRVVRLFDAIRSYSPPRIAFERAVFFTESFKTKEGQPLVWRWAKALQHIAANISVAIFDDALIVGRANTWLGRYSLVYPERRIDHEGRIAGARLKRLVPMFCAGILGLTGAGVAQTLVIEELPQRGTDISVGADGTAWLVGYDTSDKTRNLYRWNGSAWDQMEGDGFRIAVDPQGKPWVLDGDGDVKYWDGASWFERPGRGTDIAVGANGDVWMVGWYNDLLDTDRNPENRDIFHWTGTDWEKIDGGAVRIAVAPDGTPWILNDDGRLRQRVDGEWLPVDGRATDIGIGADGAIWVTSLTDDWGEDGKLAMLQGTNWITQTRSSAEVTVDPTGMPWFSQGDGDVLRGLGYEGHLETPVVSGGHVELSFFTLSGTNYVVQVRPYLGSPWTEMQHVVGNGDKVTVTNTPSAEAATSFYGVFPESTAPAAEVAGR